MMIESPFFVCKQKNQASNISVTYENVGMGISLVRILFAFDSRVTPDQARFTFTVPCVDVYSTWRPVGGAVRNVAPNWRKLTAASRLASGAPVLSMISKGGNNRVTVALSDAQTPCTIGCGVLEETAELEFRIDLFTQLVSPLDSYEIAVRIDQRDIPFYDALADVEKWWHDDLGFAGAYVPDAAKMPVDSLWYSFHQELDPASILAECKASKALGMDTVIIDDGWQTDDNHRGYEYCGDWKLAKEKIPNLKKLVDDLHAIGMKVMLWFSVPYVGIYSGAYAEFEDMYLCSAARNRTVMVLDPRYKKVRDYLSNIYVSAVKSYGLDGLKLDFIDAFSLSEMSVDKTFEDGNVSLENGVEMLLSEVMEKLRAINPEILIEFRQTYVGPTIRKYGNMLRVADCPNDTQSNRNGIIDLRLISGSTAVHSDMIMWHRDETNEAAAAQLLAVMFGVPQISLRIPELKEDHRRLLAYFLSFWREHRDVLLEGKLIVKDPDVCYSMVMAQKDQKTIAVRYLSVPFEVQENNSYRLFNATTDENVTILANSALGFDYKIFDCLGNTVGSGRISDTAVALLKVPASRNVELLPIKS
jgi:alpha-galactosidase